MKEKLRPKIQKPALMNNVDLSRTLLKVDMFSKPMPMFNIKGQRDVRTHCGACLSVAIIFTTIAFAYIKLQHLLERYNPNINVHTIENAFDETEVWRASDQKDFMMAFAVTGTTDFTNVKEDLSF